MVEVTINTEFDADEPVLVDGFPGVGLVGKIAADHLVDEFDMVDVGHVTGEGIPKVAVFEEGHEVKPPVRLYGDEDRELLVLRSDVPVSALGVPALAEELTEWLADADALPAYLSGFPHDREPDALPSMYGVATGDAVDRLVELDVDPPEGSGMMSGPAGALLDQAREAGLDAVGLVVETDPRFPDPQGARVLLEEGVAPLADVEVDTDRLVEQADEIVEQREQLAQRMQQADSGESSQVSEISMYQ